MTKKFYQNATTIDAKDQYKIHLDDRALKTPKGHIFNVPTLGLAHHIAGEWNAVSDIIQPQNMPVTQICMTALDFYDEKKSEWSRDILAYLDSDALCFWTGEVEPIYERQNKLIRPIIESLEKHLSIPIKITDRLEIITQDKRWHDYFYNLLNTLSPIGFTNFYLTTIECGSIFLAAALYHGLITPTQIFDIIYLEDKYKGEIYKEEIYGIAPDLERKQNSSQKFLIAAQIVFQSL